jgi:signal transduction histidine kinase
VTRLVYGERGDPYTAVSRLTASTERVSTRGQAVTEVARSIAASLRVPWVLVAAGDATAEWGRRPAVADDEAAPLLSAGTRIGTVRVAVPPERRWRDDDARLLDALARHGGLAVEAIGLAEEVGISRQRLVSAREEERRRVGRDLHDGLGPTLAAIAMQLGTLRQQHEPGSPEAVRLGRLEEAAREALDDVRRVARELRPTSLDQFGLVEALRRDAADLGIVVESEGELEGDVPAAVEVAAYRIGQQALANVAAHAGVSVASLLVVVSPDGLCLEVADRGRGFDHALEGVGWSSMRERAEELGGSFRVTSTGVGTVVAAWLPMTGTRTGAHA